MVESDSFKCWADDDKDEEPVAVSEDDDDEEEVECVGKREDEGSNVVDKVLPDEYINVECFFPVSTPTRVCKWSYASDDIYRGDGKV